MNHNSFPSSTEAPDVSNVIKPAYPEALDHLPTTSPDTNCSFYLRELVHTNKMGEVKDFLIDTTSREFHEFTDPIDLDAFSTAYGELLDQTLSAEDAHALLRYTGFDYRAINQVARGIWEYDTIGKRTPEREAEIRQAITAINTVIFDAPSPGVDFIAHRGTNLDGFRDYKISSLDELKNLEGQFYLERGFTSTSLSPNHSFAHREFDDPLRKPCDISITYHIPREAEETVGLLSSKVAYNPKQYELLIDQYALFYVSNADVTDDQTSAHLEMTLIPRSLYDQYYAQKSPEQ